MNSGITPVSIESTAQAKKRELLMAMNMLAAQDLPTAISLLTDSMDVLQKVLAAYRARQNTQSTTATATEFMRELSGDDWRTHLASHLCGWLVSQKLTLRAAEGIIGLDHSTIQRVCTGKGCDVETLIRIHMILKLPLQSLLGL